MDTGSIKIGAFDREVLNCPECGKPVSVRWSAGELYSCCEISTRSREAWNNYAVNTAKAKQYTEIEPKIVKHSNVETCVQSELSSFLMANSQPLQIGLKVCINERSIYFTDYQGTTLVIVGINWDRHHSRLNLTLGDDMNDVGSDGWRPEEVSPVFI